MRYGQMIKMQNVKVDAEQLQETTSHALTGSMQTDAGQQLMTEMNKEIDWNISRVLINNLSARLRRCVC